MTTTMTDVPAPDRLGNEVIRVSASEWFVRSRKFAAGAYWRVQTAKGDEPVCGCPAGRSILASEPNRGAVACHHLRVAVDFEVKRDRLAHPRPNPGPPAPGSRFVD